MLQRRNSQSVIKDPFRGVGSSMGLQIRHGESRDLAAIVAIYNAAIPGRLATADTEAVTVTSREDWFSGFNADSRPIWVAETDDGQIVGWLGIRSFYGRPAYHRTVESAVYVAPEHQREGVARHAFALVLGGGAPIR